MTSAFRSIAIAYRDVLLAAPAVAGGRVRLAAPHPAPQEWPQWVEVRTVQADGRWPYAGLGTPAHWETGIAIDCSVRAAAAGGADDAHAACDALLQDVAARVFGAAVPGVLDANNAVRVDWDAAQLDTAVASVTLSFVVRHDTAGYSLAA